MKPSKQSFNHSAQALVNLFQLSVDIHHVNKVLEKHAGLSLVQWCLMRSLIDRPGVSAQELADVVGIHPSTLTPALQRLERKGFVFVGEDPRDSRKKIIVATSKGFNVYCGANQKIESLVDRLKPVANDITRLQAHRGVLRTLA